MAFKFQKSGKPPYPFRPRQLLEVHSLCHQLGPQNALQLQIVGL
jgi:hypothetical protein